MGFVGGEHRVRRGGGCVTVEGGGGYIMYAAHVSQAGTVGGRGCWQEVTGDGRRS